MLSQEQLEELVIRMRGRLDRIEAWASASGIEGWEEQTLGKLHSVGGAESGHDRSGEQPRHDPAA